jgi:hypothetical protein
MKPLRGGEGGTRNMTGKVGADTGGVESANANGSAGINSRAPDRTEPF